jgi:hypothetical protein
MMSRRRLLVGVEMTRQLPKSNGDMFNYHHRESIQEYEEEESETDFEDERQQLPPPMTTTSVLQTDVSDDYYNKASDGSPSLGF